MCRRKGTKKKKPWNVGEPQFQKKLEVKSTPNDFVDATKSYILIMRFFTQSGIIDMPSAGGFLVLNQILRTSASAKCLNLNFSELN